MLYGNAFLNGPSKGMVLFLGRKDGLSAHTLGFFTGQSD